MINTTVINQIKALIPAGEAYQEFNPSDPVIFPYAVYKLDIEDGPDEGSLIGDLDVEVFDDRGRDLIQMESICQAFRDHFRMLNFWDDGYFFSFHFINARTIPTLTDAINRRMIKIKIRIDKGDI